MTPKRSFNPLGLVARLAVAALVACGLVAGSTSTAFASATYRTLDAVNVRSTPSTSGIILNVIPKGYSVTIDCYLNGTSVSGTTIWDHLTTGGYVTDSLILTGSDGPVVPLCAGQSAPQADPATCYAASCEGLNPQATTCTQDARTLAVWRAKVDTHDYGTLEMRYSPKCHSNWVRFVPTGGLTGLLGNLTGGIINSTPYIWRLGVDGSLRGFGGGTDPSPFVDRTTWSQMVTADGTTCSSVELTGTEVSEYGGGDTHPLGTFNAPCIS